MVMEEASRELQATCAAWEADAEQPHGDRKRAWPRLRRVYLLLQAGADPRLSDGDGVKPIERLCACAHAPDGTSDAVRMLISYGADPWDGLGPWARAYSDDAPQENLVVLAHLLRHVQATDDMARRRALADVVVALLLHHVGARPPESIIGWCMVVGRLGRRAIVRRLLARSSSSPAEEMEEQDRRSLDATRESIARMRHAAMRALTAPQRASFTAASRRPADPPCQRA